MRLTNLHILDFKNYEEAHLEFVSKYNCFVGLNGSGKTNLLDAIHYLSLTKSGFSSTDLQGIRHDQVYFISEGNFDLEDKDYHVICSHKKGNKKIVKVDRQDYQKLAEHIGRFPSVLITPNDTDLIREGGELRRKFIDNTLSQLSIEYLHNLIEYHKFLKQRNQALKQFAERKFYDKALLSVYDESLIPLSQKIHSSRLDFLTEFRPTFQKYYSALSESAELVHIEYSSQVNESNFSKAYRQSLEKDLATQRTNMGAHKDDFLFLMDELPIRKYGSQGQQKSFIISLKLAQSKVLQEKKGTAPILLMDDIFDKLDDLRIQKLLELVGGDDFGQLFITDARPERSEALLGELGQPVKIFEIEKGNIKRAYSL